MGKSLVQNYIHIVFSTKNRAPLIQPAYEKELYAYLGGICEELGCTPIAVGGHIDHVHILCMLSKNIALSKFMELLKSNSSKWMKGRHSDFYWQNGYGAFSVSPLSVESVTSYIQNQHLRHKNKGFQDEFRYFLKKYQLKYDERHIWD